MPIEKGSAYGSPAAPWPADGVVIRSDAEARHVLEAARTEGRPYPTIGVLAGDLCRTLGGPGDEDRIRSGRGVAFPVDLGQVLVDGRLHLFVAHVVARNRWWTSAVAAMNAQWVGDWNLGPRAHPNDGKVDVYEADLPIGEVRKVRARLPTGTHLPHPGIRAKRGVAVQVELMKPQPVWIDGERIGDGRVFAFRVEPDALTVIV